LAAYFDKRRLYLGLFFHVLRSVFSCPTSFCAQN
jgi:hypothetical protein